MTSSPGAPAYPHGSPEPDAPLVSYADLHRSGRRGVWRPLVGVLVLLVSFFIAGAVLVVGLQVLRAVVAAQRGADFVDALSWVLLDVDALSPWGLAYLALSLAVLIPLAIGVQRLLHGLRPGSLMSVVGRTRWPWLVVCVGLSLVALFATLVVSAVVPADDTAGAVDGSLITVDERTWWFVAVIVLLIPLQAAGEEYAFRGYLTQAFGGWLGQAAAVLVPAVLFAVAHGAQDPPVFVDRLAFGIVAGILVLRTGGLEAAIAMHVLNNWFAFSLALAFGQMDEVLTPTGGSWWSLPVTLTQSLVYLGLALWAAPRLGVARHTAGAVLPTPRGAV